MSKNSFIDSLLNQNDHSKAEFLPDLNIDNILKVICSFLNTDGGWLLIGHFGKPLVGIPDPTHDVIENLRQRVNNRIFPVPMVNIESIHYDDKDIILITVLRGMQMPYSFDKIFYIRDSNKSREVNEEELSFLLRSPGKNTFVWEKLTAIDVTFKDLDKMEIEHIISDASTSGRGNNYPKNSQEFLSYFQISDYNTVKNGAVVLFGKEPIRYLAQCSIRITVIHDGKNANKHEDTVIIEDNLFVSFYRLDEYFRKTLSVTSEFKYNTLVRTDTEAYPLDALREAIINAMVHRDYGDMSGEVTINIYKDKMEIINSGEMPPDIMKGKNTIKMYHSVLRNPTIAHMFYLRGYMEKIGRGLALILDSFERLDLSPPEWSTQGGYTTLTLFNTPKKSKKANK